MTTAEVHARGTKVMVVAAACERGVVRGIAHFTSIKDVREHVEKAVGILVGDVQWSAYEYWIPTYFTNLCGINGYDVPSGIYLFPWSKHTRDWRDPAHRDIDEGNPQFLFRPQGWLDPEKRRARLEHEQ